METNDALSYIHSTSWLGSRLGLDRTRELLEKMGNPEKKLRYVHIAGTNGKGSCAAMLASVLQAAGYKTGLFTSPYIRFFNERIQINGRAIDNDALSDITAFVRQFAEGMADHPTEFELVTAIGLEYFKRNACDMVVLEVGMGGRLDSTNVIESPEACVITTIGLDHMAELGNTVEQIAVEKAGIIKPGCDVVLYRQQPSVRAVFETVCQNRNARLRVVDFSKLYPRDADLDGQTFDYNRLNNLTISLLGAHQLFNAAVVLETAFLLREKGWVISDNALYIGLSSARWPGRFEVLQKNPVFIVDGGHNVEGISAAVTNLRILFPGQLVTFIVGMLADKAYSDMLGRMIPYAKRFIAVTPDSPRALAAEALAKALDGSCKEVLVAGQVEEGVRTALRLSGTHDVICALGSLYMTGAIRSCFDRL